MRRTPVMVMLALAVSGRAAAQQRVFFDDSLLAVRVGTSAKIVLSSDCPVGSYDITLFFDASRIQLTGAAAVPGSSLPAPTISTGTDSARLVANGPVPFTGCDPQAMATLTFSMSPGATTGSLVSMRINQLIAVEGSDATGQSISGLLDVCQALHTWGDLDDDDAITSRDALIALTAAVGLPTSGFDPSTGDVDDDGRVTARDALFILSDAIGIDEEESRAGSPIANHCAPLAPAPSDLLYWTTHGLTRVNAGDTIPTELGVFGDDGSPARFSPDGGKIAYVCNSGPNDICTVDRDGGHLHELFVGSGSDENHPVWSPDGLRIAFVDVVGGSRSVNLVDSTGLNQDEGSVVSGSNTVLELGGWSSSGLVFTRLVSSQRKLFAVHADGNSNLEVFASSSSTAPSDPSWSPAGDSVAFRNGNVSDGSIFVVGASGGSAKRRVQLIGQGSAPAWTTAGIAFSSGAFVNAEVMLQAPSGRYFRLTRTTLSGGASYPTFR